MASFALLNATTWVSGYDFTTDLNQLSLSTEVEDLDGTTYGSNGWRVRKGGLKSCEAELEGYWDAPPDAAVFGSLGSRDEPVTMTPDGTEAGTAFMFQGGKFSYEMFGAVGELTPFSLSMMGTRGEAGLVRGRLAAVPQEVDATGVLGVAVNLGPAAAGRYVYATLHCFAAGDTATVQLQADDNAGFTSPTTLATLDPLTAPGGVWTRVAGPLTDTFFRFNVSAITGAFTCAGAIAVQ